MSYTPPQSPLFTLRGADMQSTADQVFTKNFNGTNYALLFCVARQKTGAASVTCTGGIYDAASKTGNIILVNTASWVTLSSTVIVRFGAFGGGTALNSPQALLSNTPILSLTTGSTAACTADIFLYGYCID